MPYQGLFYHEYSPEYINMRRLRIAQAMVNGLRVYQDFICIEEAYGNKWLRCFVRELIWKHSETTRATKYVGCPYWSLGAANAVVTTHQQGGETLRGVAEAMSCRGHLLEITHEHVYPIRQFCDDLTSADPVVNYRGILASDNPVARMASDLALLAVGCVVLEHKEHQILNRDRVAGVRENPWQRYANADIQIVHNPLWDELHHAHIHDAGICQCQ